MKKIIAMLLALMLVASLCACGKGDEGKSSDKTAKENKPGSANTSNVSDTPIGHAMKVDGVTFGIGMDAEKVVAQLGAIEPVITESCGDMGGNDYEYVYDDFVIYANDGGGAIRIYCMEITTDLANTVEGLTIGDTTETVTSTCGAPTSQSDANIIYEQDGMQLIFFMENDEVTAIQYLEK